VKPFIRLLSLFLCAGSALAQEFELYVVDVGPNRGAPWQVLKYDQDGQNPQVFVNAGLNRPQEILFLEDRGVALVSSLGNNRINRHDAETGAFIDFFATGIGQPTRIRIGPGGLLYVLQWQGNGRVWRYDLDGNFVDEFTQVGVSNSIGLDWDSEGNLYVASFDQAHVRRFDPEGNDLGLFVTNGLVGPTNIWFDAGGDLLILDWSGGSIKRYGPDGEFEGVFVGGLSQPEGVDFLDNGDFLVGNGGTSSVRQYDKDGNFVRDLVTSGLGGLATPNGVTVRRLNTFTINAGLNDAWVSADAPLQGMFITVFPDLGLVFVAWFTFDSVSPGVGSAVFGAADQRWVTGLGGIQGNRVELAMELTSGGAFNAAEPVPVQEAGYGTLALDFKDCTEASVTYDFPGAGESGSFLIHRVVADNIPLCESLHP